MLALRQSSRLRGELGAAQRIPYAGHVSASVVKTTFGHYVQVFRLAGASFECADDEQLNTWHERLNVLLRNIAGPQWALWTHVIRRRARVAATSDRSAQGFAGELRKQYLARLTCQTLMVNDLYVETVYRPIAGSAAPLGRVLQGVQRGGAQLELDDALDACEKTAQ
ncbi:MAG: VirB4 family type IV secretion/conjugal transfer ATPase, partial [Steroidobacteraceae bacterium]